MSRPLEAHELIERSLIKRHRKTLWNPFVAAIKRYELLSPGDAVCVCVSGGKDSMLLCKLMQELHRHSDIPFSLRFLAMDPGYSAENRARLEANARLLRVPLEFYETEVFAAADAAAGDNPCYLCARMRRGHLYSRARAMGCNKIALGHHLNDVIETALISMFYGAQLQAMPPKVRSRNFEGMELIRPLYCVREEDIAAWARGNNLSFLQCACRFTERAQVDAGASKRQEIKALIAELRKTNPNLENSIFSSVHAVCLDTMPGYKRRGVRHSFLEDY